MLNMVCLPAVAVKVQVVDSAQLGQDRWHLGTCGCLHSHICIGSIVRYYIAGAACAYPHLLQAQPCVEAYKRFLLCSEHVLQVTHEICGGAALWKLVACFHVLHARQLTAGWCNLQKKRSVLSKQHLRHTMQTMVQNEACQTMLEGSVLPYPAIGNPVCILGPQVLTVMLVFF